MSILQTPASLSTHQITLLTWTLLDFLVADSPEDPRQILKNDSAGLVEVQPAATAVEADHDVVEDRHAVLEPLGVDLGSGNSNINNNNNNSNSNTNHNNGNSTSNTNSNGNIVIVIVVITIVIVIPIVIVISIINSDNNNSHNNSRGRSEPSSHVHAQCLIVCLLEGTRTAVL